MSRAKQNIILLVLAAVLCAGAFFLRHFFDERAHDEGFKQEVIQQKTDALLQQAQQEQEEVIAAIVHHKEISFSVLPKGLNIPYFIYKDQKLIFWSTQQLVPRADLLEEPAKETYISLAQGRFILKRKDLTHQSETLHLVQLIPLYRNFEVNNRYIVNHYNGAIFQSDINGVYPPDGAQGFLINDANGKGLYRADLGENYEVQQTGLHGFIIILEISWVALLLLFLWRISSQVASKHFFRGWGLLILSLSLVRALLEWINVPFRTTHFSLFNPRFYAASNVTPSVGELVIHLLFIGVAVGFLVAHFKALYVHRLQGKQKSWGKAFFLLLAILSNSLGYLLVHSFYEHSQWHLDLAHGLTLFMNLQWVAMLMLLFLGVLFFLLAHYWVRLANIWQPGKVEGAITYALLGVICLAVIFYFTGQWDLLPVLGFGVLYVGILVYWRFPKKMKPLRYQSFVYVFAGAFFYSLTIAWGIYKENQNRLVQAKTNLANQLLVENDLLGEYLLQEAIGKINADDFIISRLSSPIASKETIKEKVKRYYLSDYFDKYNVRVYLFDAIGEPVGTQVVTPSYQYFTQNFQKPAYSTENSDIYFVNKPLETSNKTYYAFLTLKRYNVVIGHIVVSLELKKTSPESVYPELLLDKRFIQQPAQENLSYAVFQTGKLNNSSGDYNYEQDFPVGLIKEKSLFTGRGLRFHNFWHRGVKGDQGKIVVVSSPVFTGFQWLSNFSFYFVCFFSLILLVSSIYAGIRWGRGSPFNLATRIQVYFNVAFFIPLLAISITVLSFINISFKEEVSDRYLKNTQNLSAQVGEALQEYFRGGMGKDELNNSLSEAAKLVNTDLNLYNAGGELLATSQPQIFDNYLLSRYCNPSAYGALKEREDKHVTLREEIGSLQYQSVYFALRSFDKGDLVGILSSPFFQSSLELNQQFADALQNVINIFTVCFLIFFIVSYFVSENLSSPLAMLRQKIRKVNFAEQNEPLYWGAQDEIGALVNEYNAMLVKLERSREALARSEKESAWREMARQVAHEIKNPLTPMKLSVQRLLRKMDEGAGSLKQEESLKALLRQIDTLSEIATSFSRFAQMPELKEETVDFEGILREVTQLYRDKEALEVEIEPGNYATQVDPKMMGQVLTNLIINAFQSIPHERSPQIKIRLTQEQQNLRLSIQDNGAGIPEEIQEKVFLPNFSTKYAGSGIGLALAKRGVEHANGRIWFETQQDVGTLFFIQLPLYEA